MWNKLFKSKSKSSKNLSSTSSSNGSTSTTPLASPPLDMVPIYNHETDINFRRNNNNKDEHNRDSIGAQMCGIPMRKSKFSNAFKSLSLRRGSTKNQLKLYPGAGDIPVGDDEIHISTVSKRDSLRPSKSDNNLNEKQNYADQEKDDVVYSEQYIQQPVVDPFLIIPEPPENLELQQCPICTRNFVPTSLAKHIGICEKMQSKKRKPFDSSRQRREGTELASYLPKNFGLPQNHPQARVSPPKTTNPVRKLSTSKTPTPQRKDYGDNGINHLMSSSLTLASTTTPTGTGPNAAMASSSCTTTPRPILKRSLSQQNEPCPYCERCFGFKAFDRHVEWCREKALLTKNANNNNSISAAKERLQARIQYKAPQIKSKRALNREKYSGSLSCGGSTNSLADLDLPLPRHRSHLNSMSSSISSDNKSDHSGSLKKVSPPNGNNGQQQPPRQHQQFELIATSKHQTATGSERKGGAKKLEIRANILENENFMRGNDNNNNNNNPGSKIFSNNLLIRPTQDVRREKEQAVSIERVEKLELIGRGGEQQRIPLKRGATKIVKCNKSGFTPDRYDPFISAKRQLEELFSASSGYNASTPRQQQNNSRSTTPLTPTANCMSKSVVTPTTKTSPVVNSNFRRASSLRMPRKVSRPMFIEKAKSNIQKGITDDGPVSPNFLKSSEYDEIPIKSAFNALQMAEKPKMRDSSTTRKNLKLDIKDPNMPATDVPLSKTDSLAVFLKYEHELNLAAMSEKDMKDKSNSLSKRSLSLGGQERKESMLYGGVTGNGLKNDRSPQDEKDKAEKILQNIQPFKKLPQKLIPIKLEPINITYSNNNSSQKTINNVNNSSKSNNITKNNNNNINSSNIGTSKPAVISLDAILGKKPKPPPPPPPQEEKENRKDPNYIDPKLINKCDNLPIVATKLSSSESECSASTIELSKKPTDSNRLAESSNSSPENSGGETGGVDGGVQQPILDKKLTNDSTNDDSYDTRPTLTRQNGTATCSSSSSRDSSREESPVEQQLRSPLARNQSHLDDTKPQTPDSGLERTTPKPSTPIPVQKKPERPPLPSFDDFDFDEFISSFEDERRSFKNALYARSTNSNCITSSSNSTSFIQHTNSSVLDNSVKSVTSLNGSVSSTSSPSHVNSSNSPHYNSINTNGRSDETQTTTHQPKEPPQVPRRRHIGELNHTPSHSTIRNLPSLQGSSVTKPAAPTPTDPRSPKATHAFGPTNDNINNNSSPLPRDTPSSSRLGSGNSFNHHHQPYQHHHQQQQHQPSTANHTNSNNNNNTISAHLVPQPYTATVTNAGSPLFDYHGISRHQSPLSNANNGSNGSGIGGPASGGGGGGIIFDDLSPTERDLMKSVQELDRMCESSSSMYPADSDEMSSVEGYPLSNSPRDHGSARHHHHRSDRPSAEGSKFSADSAYGSLSRQSPPEQHHTIRRAYGHHRGGSKSTNATSQQDTFDNSSGSESSLPPITATLKTQKVELHAHKVTPAALAGAKNAASLQMSKFCHECGSRFMIDTAKFCMECGIRRIMLD
ncbi:probable serine/threonine-protein kinase DDB_G0282963 isoform X2 [Ochlerotatus camptorhynchus]|uniref:probable serine/threonine-protein kinase DDB_G0282963 isoform X2 n=1 Tax=Ochlerotatus camptorhynchus TaxID=644619 RepID=UPI0031D64B06